MGIVYQYVRFDRHARRGALQLIEGSHRTQLCVCVCPRQHWHHGMCSVVLAPRRRFLPSLRMNRSIHSSTIVGIS